MVIKSLVRHSEDGNDYLLDFDVLIERFRKLRALNEEPDKIGLTQYTWRSFCINKQK